MSIIIINTLLKYYLQEFVVWEADVSVLSRRISQVYKAIPPDTLSRPVLYSHDRTRGTVACVKRGGNVAEASEGVFRSAQSEATAKPSFQSIEVYSQNFNKTQLLGIL